MNWNLTKRLDAAEKSVGIGRADGDIPAAIDVLSPCDRELLAPWLAARGSEQVFPAEVHRAAHRLLKAAAEQSRRIREAGIPMLTVAETLRRRRGALPGMSANNLAKEAL
jgi:hypothetical protein